MHRVILGVSGSVAAYRACDLARELIRSGFQVRTCLTAAAQRFVSQDLFEALTGQPCLSDVFEEPVRGRMAHIDWARDANLLLVAPASADVLAKLAIGIADDMLTTIALAFTGTVAVAPAMNPTMFATDRVQHSLLLLKQRGVTIIEPLEGDVACGENGQGKLASIERLTQVATDLCEASQIAKGKKFLITSGPTREPIDIVRFLSNRSSGKMGSALASAAMMMGGEVVVVSGPVKIVYPPQADVYFVETAQQMLEAAMRHVETADVIIGAAAVADYRVESPSATKVRRNSEAMELKLVANPDVIKTLSEKKKQGAVAIGFAAEPTSSLEKAHQKLMEKKLNGIAVNAVDVPGIGFDADSNEIQFLTADATYSIGPASKLRCAKELLRIALSSR